MGLLWGVLAVLAVWALVAVALALLIGGAVRIGETKRLEQAVLRELAEASAQVA